MFSSAKGANFYRGKILLNTDALDDGRLIKDLASRIRDVASRAANEEELRIGVEKLLEPLARSYGIDFHPRYEKRIAQFSGRVDAVYGRIFLEYERPGKLSTVKGRETSWHQLSRYMVAEASSEGKPAETLRRMLGIALDGYHLIFYRYMSSRIKVKFPLSSLQETGLTHFEDQTLKLPFQVMGPYEVNTDSISLFIMYLRSLARRPLKADTLVEAFGPKGESARVMLNALCSALLDSRSPKVNAFFKEWDRVFGIVYGRELPRAEKDVLLLTKAYQVQRAIEFKPLLFCVHTYFALLIKLLAAELTSLQGGSLISSFVVELPALPEEQLRVKMEQLEGGGHFSDLGIKNFLEGDFFRWYLDAWNEGLFQGVKRVVSELLNFEPATPTIEPEYARDLLKRLYQFLVPKKLRHDLGEYYTPDWIAERILNQVGYHGNPDKRLLDPGCGSGTFLVLAIKRVKQYADSRFLDPRTVVQKIIKNIVGFDLNPLAVIAARTNYLLALGELRRYISPLEIPVYMCDSIRTPSEYASLFEKYYPLETSQGVFTVPAEVSSKEEIEHLTSTIEECLRIECSLEQFVHQVQQRIPIHSERSIRILEDLYQKVLRLEQRGEDGLWARFIKNAFAPLFVGRFDYVVGNPPWVNWESLSDDYRKATTKLWKKYGLFSLKGWQSRMGGGKKDLAMLFTYASIDNYLKKRGKLGFAITQTLFKTKGAGEGFRRFRLGDEEPIKVIGVDDLVELQPFEGASNRSSIIACQKGRPTKYPVPYYLWRKKKGVSLKVDDPLEEVTDKTIRHHFTARPIDRHQTSSPWLTTTPKLAPVLKKVIGRSEYQARTGSNTGGANGVYWLRILSRRPDGLLVVENLYDIGRKKVPRVQAAIEPQLVYPLLRGRDVSRWKASPSCYILMVQDPKRRTGYPEDWMKEKFPHTYAYLKNFKTILRERAAYKKYFDPEKDPFYSMYNIGPYTFAPYKLIWREQARLFTTAVAGKLDDKCIIPDQKLKLVPFKREYEAHYMCGLLSSSIAIYFVKSYVLETSITPYVLNHANIPKFDSRNDIHNKLSELSQQAHSAAELGIKGRIKDIEEEIDLLAASLWGLTRDEIKGIKFSLAKLY